MVPPAVPIRPEELLQHAGWLGALAASLVADPASADDLVQDTYVAALKRPPSGGRELEPWLARVVRNFAKKRVRGEVRRTAREETAARPDGAASPDAILERLELQQVLVEELRALDEPWRSAIVLRYVEGHTGAEIAKLLGVPAGTVRWRLKGALDELRARLDRRFGGSRESWCAVLAPLAWRASVAGPAAAGVGTMAGTGAIAPGVLAMGAVLKLGALAAVVGVAGLFWWQMREDPQTAEPVVAASAPVHPHATPPIADESALAMSGADESGRVESAVETAPAAEPAAAPAAAVAAVSAPPAPGSIDARFVDSAGAPLAGVRFAAEEEPDHHWIESGPDGYVHLSVPMLIGSDNGWMAQFVARRPGVATRALYAKLFSDLTVHLGDIVLGPAASLAVRVVDEGGLPVDRVKVWTAETDEPEWRREAQTVFGPDARAAGPTATTDADGRALLADVAAGEWHVWAHREGSRYSCTDAIRVESGKVVSLELVLHPLLDTDKISGIVLDPSGAPVPQGKVWYESRSETSTTSSDMTCDAAGRFERLLEPGAKYRFEARDTAGRWTEAVADDVAPGTRELVLQMTEPRFFVARVRDRDGHALGSASVKIHREGSLEFQDDSRRADARGEVRIAAPVTAYTLEATAQGYRPSKQGPFRAGELPKTVEFELTPLAVVRGVVRADGAPAVGARVELRGEIQEGTQTFNGYACRMQPWAQSHVLTDAEGHFAVDVPKGGSYFVRAQLDGWATAELGPLDLDGDEGRDGVTFELTRGGTIEGRVLGPNGADTIGTIVGINHGDGQPVTQRAGIGGTFRFTGLTPGKWQVLLRDEEMRTDRTTTSTTSEPVRVEWTCEVFTGRTTVHDLDLAAKKP